ncbi:UDP-D-galactose:(glucosyl)LPS alpha-1,6-D-galactosyltransferase [Enterococcus sp. AZ194]|uniref:glycosyltransferase n=1 Tax=Enterococcus sp. AZ194 TaxID=2774629 RepID=UPI003F21C5A2
MMKVDLLIPRYSGKGGTETVVKKVADYFEKRAEVTFHLVISQGMDSLEWLGEFKDYEETNHQYSNKLMQYASGILYLSNYFKKTEAQIVICLNTTTLRIAHFFRKLYKKKFQLVSWIHFSIFDEKAIKPKYLYLADYHLAISSGIKRQLESLGIPASQIFLIFNPVERQEKTIAPVNKKTKFVYIGRLMLKGQKNISELFYGLAQLKEEWSLDIYGDGKDRQALENLTKELNIEAQVTFFGWVINPWQQIKEASALVLTSQFEGFPMVLLEAASYGLPCISSNCPTGPEDIICAQNGLVYQKGDAEGLSKALHQVSQQVFSQLEVKNSIERFYPETYFTVLEQFLYRIVS